MLFRLSTQKGNNEDWAMVLKAEAGRIRSYKGKCNMYTTGHWNTPTLNIGTVDDVSDTVDDDDVVSEEEVGLQKQRNRQKKIISK